MEDQNSIPEENRLNRTVQRTLDLLDPLVGEWMGKGIVEYPTIDDFEYSETFLVRRDEDVSYLTYEQLTVLIDSEGHPIRKSHWEAGILRPLENGFVELACVQAGGRVEVLHGQIQTRGSSPGEFSLSFQSKTIGNEERLKSSSRDWKLNGNQFKYVMRMATTKVGEPTIHLKASLSQQ